MFYFMSTQTSPERRPYSRGAAASGVVFVVLLNGALFAPGAPPKAHDSPAKIASLLADNRSAILAGMFVAGVALLFGLWFFATVATWLRPRVAERDVGLALAAPAGGVLAAAFVLGGMLLFYGAAYQVSAAAQLPVVRGLTDAGNATVEMSKFGVALFVGGVAIVSARAKVLPRWFTRAGLAAATVGIASAIPLFAEGSFTQFGGGLDLVGAAPATMWVLGLSVLMAGRAEP
jgi:hypothetical protein